MTARSGARRPVPAPTREGQRLSGPSTGAAPAWRSPGAPGSARRRPGRRSAARRRLTSCDASDIRPSPLPCGIEPELDDGEVARLGVAVAPRAIAIPEAEGAVRHQHDMLAAVGLLRAVGVLQGVAQGAARPDVADGRQLLEGVADRVGVRRRTPRRPSSAGSIVERTASRSASSDQRSTLMRRSTPGALMLAVVPVNVSGGGGGCAAAGADATPMVMPRAATRTTLHVSSVRNMSLHLCYMSVASRKLAPPGGTINSAGRRWVSRGRERVRARSAARAPTTTGSRHPAPGRRAGSSPSPRRPPGSDRAPPAARPAIGSARRRCPG